MYITDLKMVEPDDIVDAVQNQANQHVDVAVQVNLDNRNLNQFPVVNNEHQNPLIVINRPNDPHWHLRQCNAPLECRCAHPPEFSVANLPTPTYQLSFCCGISCRYHRMILTCLALNQIDAIYNLIYSDEFQYNPDFYTVDSVQPDR